MRWSQLLLVLPILVFGAACGEDERPLPETMQELSIDPPFLTSGYCLGRYCPSPMGFRSQVGENSSGTGWLVSRHYAGDAGHDDHIERLYTVELVRQKGYVEPLNEGLDPVSALTRLENDSYAYKDTKTAKDVFTRQAQGQPLSSTQLAEQLNIVGYDEGTISFGPYSTTTIWVRTGRIIFKLSGDPRPMFAHLQDATTRGLVYTMANLLVRADEPAEDMVVKGNIYFEDQLIPTTKQDVGGDIIFLQATIGPYLLDIDEFYSKPEFELTIEGTEALEGQVIEIELTSDHCGKPRNPSDCFASERIEFQPGETITTDLHFRR